MTPNNSRRAVYLPLALALMLIGGFYLGLKLAPVSSGGDSMLFVRQSNYNKVSEIIRYIEQDYVDSISLRDLEGDAIEGILEHLDPHSYYISAEQYHDVNDPLTGNFEGIGVQFRVEKDTITVIQTISGGPSEKVGLLAGDRIVRVNDSLVAGVGITNKNVVSLLKGPRGTQVDVSIYRKHHSGLYDFSITRDVIPTYSVDIAYMVDDELGYIKVSKFSETTQSEFVAAMKQLLDRGMEQLILDLRGNYGGYLRAAIEMSDEFLTEKTLIVYTEGNSRPNNYYYATRKGSFEFQELTVLIDEASASASEIVAGAVQDNDRGLIIGRRSFGKGLVQEQLTLPDGSALRLTIARYHTPTGRNIQRPYENGSEEYYEDYHQRFLNGELESADSIHFNDSLRYVTEGGKVVYGGGGIMPDIFVPVSNGEEEYKYYYRLLQKNLIFQFAFDYTDNNRALFEGYDNFASFDDDFVITDKLFGEMVALAEAEGIEAGRKEIRKSDERIRILLKAYIGRNILDDAGFYPVYHLIDNTFIEAYHQLKR